LFWDIAEITVKAGNGGDGATSFLHEKFRAKGGPDGGDGGKGGDVVFLVDKGLSTLSFFRNHRKVEAAHGAPGGKSRKHGKNGADTTIKIPLGTVVNNLTTEKAVADLDVPEQELVVAEGGDGGFGNAHFTSSTRQAPRVAELGEKGDEFKLRLELKLVADVGLVGLPNAGKSSLLARITAAKPEVADYPFTTKIPQLGVVEEGPRSFVVCDIPGLIEGAHEGKGLGDEFLRHVERCKFILHLVDGTSQDIEGEIAQIEHELKNYGEGLLGKPRLLVLTKCDLPHAMHIRDRFLKTHKGAVAISSASGDGIQNLLNRVAEELSKIKPEEAEKKPKFRRITIEDEPELFTITKKDARYVVTGQKIERFARRLRLENPHAQARIRDIMRRMGINRELTKQGAEEGDKVEIGGQTIEFRG
jgi:GTP-binding protein